MVDGVKRLVWWSLNDKGWYMDKMSANVMHTPKPKVFKPETEKMITNVMKTPKPKHKLFKNIIPGTGKLFKVARELKAEANKQATARKTLAFDSLFL